MAAIFPHMAGHVIHPAFLPPDQNILMAAAPWPNPIRDKIAPKFPASIENSMLKKSGDYSQQT